MANSLVNIDNLSTAFVNFHKEKYSHCVIDNFLDEDVADKIATEFFAHDSDLFNGNYNNQIELKRTCNIWDRFPASIYQLITYLNSTSFIDVLSNHTGHSRLYSDPGIHGGGLHSHPNGGKLNPHRDYSLHPKLDYSESIIFLSMLLQTGKKNGEEILAYGIVMELPLHT
jgi:hypothetical protein